MSGSMNIEGIKKLTEKLGISGKSLLFATLCVIGVALILFGNLFSAEKKEKSSQIPLHLQTKNITRRT